ncbi:hypothetical protein VMCG_06850 [Cytospora schulzeri]|uniref:YAG7-like dimerisation domain-containing protein n=1 Tax=Cytospora schulzeri TaxID=448051 RepID=A0A423W2B0_9PEZI|nr:hypothetical protein VMCG_06850 [Valsa malicola]
MAASSVQNPLAPSESKSSKKKKAKAAAEQAESPAQAATPEQAGSVSGNNDVSDNAYVRELKKGIRNTNKKIANASKTQALIDEHQGKSPEELVAAKIINADQKKQVDNLNKLKAEVARYEEQLVQFQKVDEEYRAKLASVKADTEKSLTEKYEQEKADAVAEAKDKAEADAKKSLHDGFLVLSQFLRLAAHRRAEAPGSEDDEDMALEGILLSVYGGDELAVTAMLKLYEGTDDETTGVDGAALQTTFATVKASAAAHSAPLYQVAAEAETAPVETAKAVDAVQTDPTIANAGLTEIDAGTDTALTSALTNGHSDESHVEASIPNADLGDSAANAAAENQWDTGNDLAASQEWVEVKVPVESPQTETAPSAPTATLTTSTPSWADDHPAPSPSEPLLPLLIPMMASSLSSAVVVTTAMVDSVDTVVVAAVVTDVVMATEAVDEVDHEVVREAVPAAMPLRRRHRGRANIAKDAVNCGGGEWVWTQALKQAVA